MSVKIRTKGFFETKAHRVISRVIDQVIVMPDEDYEEVKDLCEVIEPPPEKKVTEPPKVIKSSRKKSIGGENATSKSKISRNN